MIGLALVSAGGVLAASIVKSANDVIDRSVGADFIVTTKNFLPIPGSVADEIRKVDGVAAVTSFRSGQAKIAGSVSSLQGVTADTVDKTLQLKIVKGDLASLGDGDVLVGEKLADKKGWKVGQRLPVTFGKTGESSLTIGGIYAENQIAGDYLISPISLVRSITDNASVLTMPRAAMSTASARSTKMKASSWLICLRCSSLNSLWSRTSRFEDFVAALTSLRTWTRSAPGAVVIATTWSSCWV
jgi:putative ABC transport system permease protein